MGFSRRRMLGLVTLGLVISNCLSSEDSYDNVLYKITHFKESTLRVPRNDVKKGTTVAVSIVINNLRLDLSKMEASTSFYIRQAWYDSRLNYTHLQSQNDTEDANFWTQPYITLSEDWHKHIWKPDVYTQNAVSTSQSSSITTSRLYQNGTVLCNQRAQVILYCPMAYFHFPFDSNVCTIKLESYAYTVPEMELKWMEFVNPAQLDRDLQGQHYNYNIENITTGVCHYDDDLVRIYLLTALSETQCYEQVSHNPCNCQPKKICFIRLWIRSWHSITLTQGNAYPQQKVNFKHDMTEGMIRERVNTTVHVAYLCTRPCIKAEIYVKREYQVFLTQVYFPSCLTVVLSWLAFWIDREALAARVSLGSLCVVTIMTHATGLSSVLPDMPRMKAVNVWESVCISIVFIAMLEFALMHSMCRRKAEVRRLFAETANENTEETRLTENTKASIQEERGKNHRKLLFRPLFKWNIEPARIDVVARVLFPTVFLVFNIIYWPVYMF